MDQAFLIYLLSIAENVGSTLSVTGNICLAAALAVYGVGTIKHWVAIGGYNSDKHLELEYERYKLVEPHNRKISVWFGVCAGLLWIVGAMFPTTESVLKAYALIEGSKVINAENAEIAAEAVGKRFDKFLDIVDRGINGRHTEAAPAVPPKEPASK